MSKEPEHAQPVVDCHDHGAEPSQILAVVSCGFAQNKPSAMNPHHYRQLFRRVFDWRIDIEVKTVFAHRRELHAIDQFQSVRLWFGVTELRARSHSGPGFHRLRSLPPKLANGRRGVRNSFEDSNVLGVSCHKTGNHAGIDLNRSVIGRFRGRNLIGWRRRKCAQSREKECANQPCPFQHAIISSSASDDYSSIWFLRRFGNSLERGWKNTYTDRTHCPCSPDFLISLRGSFSILVSRFSSTG